MLDGFSPHVEGCCPTLASQIHVLRQPCSRIRAVATLESWLMTWHSSSTSAYLHYEGNYSFIQTPSFPIGKLENHWFEGRGNFQIEAHNKLHAKWVQNQEPPSPQILQWFEEHKLVIKKVNHDCILQQNTSEFETKPNWSQQIPSTQPNKSTEPTKQINQLNRPTQPLNQHQPTPTSTLGEPNSTQPPQDAKSPGVAAARARAAVLRRRSPGAPPPPAPAAPPDRWRRVWRAASDATRWGPRSGLADVGGLDREFTNNDRG